MTRHGREPVILLVTGLALLALSGLHPRGRLTWLMEVAPVLLGVQILVGTYTRFPLTPLLYRLLFVHAAILMVGGHYSYAEVPLGFWMQRVLGLARNDYDRIGHVAQGFVPAILAREVLLRRSVLSRGGWLFFLVTSVCLAFSAFKCRQTSSIRAATAATVAAKASAEPFRSRATIRSSASRARLRTV